MAYRRLLYPGGIDVESSATSSRNSLNSSNLIRFRNALDSIYVEKLGGWVKFCNTAVTGVCRALNYWVDLVGGAWFGAGTNTNLYVEADGLLSDITPVGFPGGKASSGAVPYSLLIWSLDNFGQVLLALPSGGTLYSWTPSAIVPAAPVADAPDVAQGMFVAGQQQIVVAYGCTPFGGGTPDPLLARWSDQGDYTNWTPSTTNQAGSFRLPRGSRIISGLSIPLANLLFTDIDVWSMQYIGFPLVFGFRAVGVNCGAISQKSIGVLGSSVYWMSIHGFFAYSGGQVQQIPCSVWDAVFYDLDPTNQDKICCLINFDFNEVWWFYPSISGGTGEIDKYIKFNNLINVWDYGTLARTAGTDQNQPGGPIWVDLNGFMQQHEQGVDDDGQPMTGVFYQSGFLDIADGQDFPFVDQYVPDNAWTLSTAMNPEIQVSLLFRNWPGDTPTVEGPFTITPTTEYVSPRARGREIAERVSCDALGTWFRRGTPRIRIASSGRV